MPLQLRDIDCTSAPLPGTSLPVNKVVPAPTSCLPLLCLVHSWRCSLKKSCASSERMRYPTTTMAASLTPTCQGVRHWRTVACPGGHAHRCPPPICAADSYALRCMPAAREQASDGARWRLGSKTPRWRPALPSSQWLRRLTTKRSPQPLLLLLLLQHRDNGTSCTVIRTQPTVAEEKLLGCSTRRGRG